MVEALLVLDAGTGAGRALVVDRCGKVLATAYREWSYEREEATADAVHFDPYKFEDLLFDAAAECLQLSDVHPTQIAAVTVTSLREGVLFIDQSGNVLYAGPNFDERAHSEGKQLAEAFGREIYFTSGTYPPAYGFPARVLWFKTHRPKIYASIDTLLSMGDWVTWRLCGRTVTEPTLASSSGIFDVTKREWSTGLAEKLGVDPAWLPTVEAAGQQVGTLTKEAATRIGLSKQMPVVLGGADTQCATLGMGLIQTGHTGCVAGTTSPVQHITARPQFDEEMRTWTNCHVISSLWNLESNAIVTGLALRWLRDCLQDIRKDFSYAQLNDLVVAAAPGCNGVTAFLGAEPMDMTGYRATWQGGFLFPVPPGDIGIEDLIRAAMESNAYAVRANLEQVADITGKAIFELHLTGGQTASRISTQILSAVLGRRVIVHHEQSSAIGAAMCAAVGAEIYETMEEAVDYMIDSVNIVEPSPALESGYRDLYQTWLARYRRIRQFD